MIHHFNPNVYDACLCVTFLFDLKVTGKDHSANALKLAFLAKYWL